MKKFKDFIKEATSPENINRIAVCFDSFRKNVEMWNGSSNEIKAQTKEDDFNQINLADKLSTKCKFIKENTEDLVEYLKDPANKEYAKKNTEDIISVVKEIYGDNVRGVAVLQYLDDVKKLLDQAPATTTSSQEIPPKIKEALDNLGLEY